MAEMSEQGIESMGKVHVKNVCERRGSGSDYHTLNLIARRTTVTNCMGIINNIVPYLKDVYKCKNKDRYDPLWSDKHEMAANEVGWRDERTRMFLLLIFF